jgi:fatty acid desaturase
MFRNPADRIPAFIVLAATVIDFGLYFFVDSPWILAAAWLLSIPLTGGIGAWSHHHQHCFTFRSVALNRALELGHALQTGIATHLWVLHHVFGHHLNYLDQTKDESGWRDKSGKQMGVLEYIVTVMLTSYWRAFKVGKKLPQYQGPFVTWSLITLAIVVGLVWYRPIPGLLVFVLPMVSGLAWIVWATYDHHAGLPTDDQWSASYNIENRLYNFISCNLGYHTAHHYKPGVHWSRLPRLHREIRHKIPPKLLIRSTFDRVLPEPSIEAPEPAVLAAVVSRASDP